MYQPIITYKDRTVKSHSSLANDALTVELEYTIRPTALSFLVHIFDGFNDYILPLFLFARLSILIHNGEYDSQRLSTTGQMNF